MYAISIVSAKENHAPREASKPNQLNSLLSLVNIIYGQLNFIKDCSSNGEVLNEIIERTEILAFNIKHNHDIVLSTEYIEGYQRNLWQLLSQLHEAEKKDGLSTQREEHKRIFFELFKQMDQIVEKFLERTKGQKLVSLN